MEQPDEAKYTLFVFRDPHSCKRMDASKVFKYATSEEAQAHARRLLKTKTLSHRDIRIVAPETPAMEA